MSIVKYILLFALSISLLSGDDHETVIDGTVFKNEKGNPLEGANILIKNNNGQEYGTTSDRNGGFRLENISSGNYSLTVSFIGYEDYRENIKILKGKIYNVNVTLNIEPILMAKLEIISELDAPYENLPGAASVINMQRIKLTNPIGTQEMLEYVPGINGFSDDGIGNSRISIGIRGLNPRRSSRVLILEDGVPIQPALYVYPNMYYNPPADRIDQIEVIKGSGTILYGPQTMGGIINYFTKRPRNEFGGLAKFTVGENRYNSLFTEIGGLGKGKLRSELQLLVKKGDGFRENNKFEQINNTLKLNYRRSATKNLYLKANYNYEDSQATYTGLTQLSFDENPKFNPKEDDNFKVVRAALDLIQSEKISANISKSTTAFLSFFDRRWWRENDVFIKVGDLDQENPTPQPYYGSNLVRVGNGVDNFGILRTFYVAGLKESYNIDHTLLGNPSTMETGWRVYWERFIDDRKTGFTSDSVFATDAREGVYFRGSGDSLIIYPGSNSHHYETAAFSAFISQSIDFGTFTLRPGLRLEMFEQERVDRLAGSLYQDKTLIVPLPGIALSSNMLGNMLFGGVHRGFTPPSSGALKILNFGEGIEDPDLDLEAEKSWNKEIGIRGSLALLDYEIAGFHIGIENLVAAGRGTAFKNLGKVNSQGVEVRTDFLLSKMSKLMPNIGIAYTYLSTEVVDGIITSNIQPVGQEVSINGKKLPYSPDHTLNVNLELNPISSFFFRLDYKYVSKVYTDFQNLEDEDDRVGYNLGISGPIPSYSLINLSSSYQLSQKMKLFLTGKNITDEIYIGSRLHSNPGQKDANISSGILPGPRRQVNLGIEYTF